MWRWKLIKTPPKTTKAEQCLLTVRSRTLIKFEWLHLILLLDSDCKGSKSKQKRKINPFLPTEKVSPMNNVAQVLADLFSPVSKNLRKGSSKNCLGISPPNLIWIERFGEDQLSIAHANSLRKLAITFEHRCGMRIGWPTLAWRCRRYLLLLSLCRPYENITPLNLPIMSCNVLVYEADVCFLLRQTWLAELVQHT